MRSSAGGVFGERHWTAVLGHLLSRQMVDETPEMMTFTTTRIEDHA